MPAARYIAIDKGIPIPRGVDFPTTAARHHDWPWGLQVGDSFAVPDSVNIANFRCVAQRAENRHNITLTVRKTPDGYRCWRVK